MTPWTVACQAPLSMGLSRQEYCSQLPFPSPGDLQGTRPGDQIQVSHIAGRFFIIWATREALDIVLDAKYISTQLKEKRIKWQDLQNILIWNSWKTTFSVLYQWHPVQCVSWEIFYLIHKTQELLIFSFIFLMPTIFHVGVLRAVESSEPAEAHYTLLLPF